MGSLIMRELPCRTISCVAWRDRGSRKGRDRVAKRGRKNAYETRIKPKFKEIAELAKKGVTEASIAKQIGVSRSTFEKYKNEFPELSDLLKNNRLTAVDDIENSMYQSACGIKRTVKKVQKTRHIEYENGRKIREWEEMTPYTEEIFIPPNPTAAIYLLKHWGKDRGYTNDPLTLELKKEELELKKEIADANNW